MSWSPHGCCSLSFTLNVPRFLLRFFFRMQLTVLWCASIYSLFFRVELLVFGCAEYLDISYSFLKLKGILNYIWSHLWNYDLWGICVLMSNIGETSWWRHEMETFFALLALCAGNSPVTGEFPSQRPVTQSLNKRLSKQCWGWWFETPSCSLWRHYNGNFSAQTLFWFALAAE